MPVADSEISADISELRSLLNQASRSSVRNILATHISKLETQLKSAAAPQNVAPTKCVTNSSPTAAVTTLLNYAWDQSDKFVKLYVTFKDSANVNKDNVKFECTENGTSMHVNHAGRNYSFAIKELAHEIDVKESYFKVKSDDMILLMLRKQKTSNNWEAVTLAERRIKDAKAKPSQDAAGDPQAGMMNMMKQMYDDGDDDMKRNIKKAWVESQDKKLKGESGGDMPGMGGLGGLEGMMGEMGDMPGLM